MGKLPKKRSEKGIASFTTADYAAIATSQPSILSWHVLGSRAGERGLEDDGYHAPAPVLRAVGILARPQSHPNMGWGVTRPGPLGAIIRSLCTTPSWSQPGRTRFNKGPSTCTCDPRGFVFRRRSQRKRVVRKHRVAACCLLLLLLLLLSTGMGVDWFIEPVKRRLGSAWEAEVPQQSPS